MSAARFGYYVHSDSTTPGKGAAVTVLAGGSGFADAAARFAYGSGCATWPGVAGVFPHADEERSLAGAEVLSIAILSLSPGEAGRVGISRSAKAAAIAKVLSTTDFGARTPLFSDFAGRVAEAAVRNSASDWGILAALEPDLEGERQALSRELREAVEISAIELVTV